MIIALVILILLTIMSTVFIEKLFRFSQASNGIENSNIAYYNALWIIEETLYGPWVNKYTPWNVSSASIKNAYTGKTMTVYTGSQTVPALWRWNSPYDSNYNIIGIWNPVQLVIPNGIDWSQVFFEFRVPKTESGMTSTWVDIPGWRIQGWTGVILWTLASSWWLSLFASGETNIVKAQDINSTPLWQINVKNGTSNTGTAFPFWSFYGLGSMCTGYACTLKLSMIRSVPIINWPTLSFLEYKISGFPSAIPSQYMTLHAEWYSQWFLRTKEIQFPQITTNTALDFAVLQ